MGKGEVAAASQSDPLPFPSLLLLLSLSERLLEGLLLRARRSGELPRCGHFAS
jgi:hypothetical protein